MESYGIFRTVSMGYLGIFRTKSNIYDGAFFILVKPYFKNVLKSIKFPLGNIFCKTHPFVKKLTTVKTFGGKVFC